MIVVTIKSLGEPIHRRCADIPDAFRAILAYSYDDRQMATLSVDGEMTLRYFPSRTYQESLGGLVWLDRDIVSGDHETVDAFNDFDPHAFELPA